METLPSKYLRLMGGLDEESRRAVQVALSRLLKLHMNGWPRKMRFDATTHEAMEIKRIKDDMGSRIIYFPNAANGTWIYENWLIEQGDMLLDSFFHKVFIEDLDDLRAVRRKDILDVGAYNGDTALVFHGYTDCKVYAFEPSARHMEIMLETFRINDSTKIIPVPYGLGDREETLFMPDRVDGQASFTASGLPAKVTTLDEWAKHSGAEIGLIKVDIEGHEQRFLKGAVETLRKHRPALLISIYHNASDLFEIKPFIESLGLGYRFKIRRPADKHFIIEGATLICEQG
jgi:FkbM family methyltransferase